MHKPYTLILLFYAYYLYLSWILCCYYMACMYIFLSTNVCIHDLSSAVRQCMFVCISIDNTLLS